MTKTLGEIAAFVGGRLAGDAAIEIRGATNIEDARASDITFAVEPHLKEAGNAPRERSFCRIRRACFLSLPSM